MLPCQLWVASSAEPTSLAIQAVSCKCTFSLKVLDLVVMAVALSRASEMPAGSLSTIAHSVLCVLFQLLSATPHSHGPFACIRFSAIQTRRWL